MPFNEKPNRLSGEELWSCKTWYETLDHGSPASPPRLLQYPGSSPYDLNLINNPNFPFSSKFQWDVHTSYLTPRWSLKPRRSSKRKSPAISEILLSKPLIKSKRYRQCDSAGQDWGYSKKQRLANLSTEKLSHDKVIQEYKNVFSVNDGIKDGGQRIRNIGVENTTRRQAPPATLCNFRNSQLARRISESNVKLPLPLPHEAFLRRIAEDVEQRLSKRRRHMNGPVAPIPPRPKMSPTWHDRKATAHSASFR